MWWPEILSFPVWLVTVSSSNCLVFPEPGEGLLRIWEALAFPGMWHLFTSRVSETSPSPWRGSLSSVESALWHAQWHGHDVFCGNICQECWTNPTTQKAYVSRENALCCHVFWLGLRVIWRDGGVGTGLESVPGGAVHHVIAFDTQIPSLHAVTHGTLTTFSILIVFHTHSQHTAPR